MISPENKVPFKFFSLQALPLLLGEIGILNSQGSQIGRAVAYFCDIQR
jgi:hypothetical protein